MTRTSCSSMVQGEEKKRNNKRKEARQGNHGRYHDIIIPDALLPIHQRPTSLRLSLQNRSKFKKKKKEE